MNIGTIAPTKQLNTWVFFFFFLDYFKFLMFTMVCWSAFRRTWASTSSRGTHTQGTWAQPASSPPPSWRAARTSDWSRFPSWDEIPGRPSGRLKVRDDCAAGCRHRQEFVALTRETVPLHPVPVDYLVIRPIQGLQCDMSASFAKYWKKRSTLDVGHRGAGSSYAAKWVTNLRYVCSWCLVAS